KGLKELGYTVDISNNEEEIMDMAINTEYDLLILDVIGKKINGIEICKIIKKKYGKIKILFMSEEEDVDLKIKALDSGGDDYIVRPFNFRELSARIRAILRRESKSFESILRAKDLTLNLMNREVKRAEKILDLTVKEFALLEYLMRNKNLVLTRTIIKEKIWSIDFLTNTNIVDVYITHLREKIDKNHSEKLIYTVRGIGYILKD
ncbi:MAG: response regulator transcription factor, partial [Cetobacterium sp.]